MVADRLGASTYCCILEPLEVALGKLENTGFSLVEILSDGMHDLLNDCEPCFSFGMEYVVHAPIDLNIASVREPIRKASVEVLKGVVEVANRIDSDLLVIHPGHYGWHIEKERAYRACANSVMELSRFSEDFGVRIAVENMTDWGNSLLRSPMDGWVIGNAGLALDVGHAHLMHELENFLEDSRVIHLHIHDNDGQRDSHDALGRGNLKLEDVFSMMLERNVRGVIEVNSLDALKESVLWLKTHQVLKSHFDSQSLPRSPDF
jgi:sugar phosphate isomerase/epimerase